MATTHQAGNGAVPAPQLRTRQHFRQPQNQHSRRGERVAGVSAKARIQAQPLPKALVAVAVVVGATGNHHGSSLAALRTIRRSARAAIQSMVRASRDSAAPGSQANEVAACGRNAEPPACAA